MGTRLNASQSPLMLPTEVAIMLRVKLVTIYRMVEARELPSIKIGRIIRFHRKDLEERLSEARKTGKFSDTSGRKKGKKNG